MKFAYAFACNVAVVVACMFMIGCATAVEQIPTQFTSFTSEKDLSFVLTQNVAVAPTSSFQRTLKAGSRWKYIGQIPQGSVFRIQDDVFQLVGRHLHEAHCVIVKDNELVGFFLPVEQTFAPLSSSVKLPIK